MEALGGRVVAAVGDDQVDQRQHRGLGDELLAPHVGGQLVLVVLGTLRDDVAVRGAAEHVDQPPHQVDVGRTERPEREVHQPAFAAAQAGGDVKRRVGAAHARLHPLPHLAERPRSRVVELGRVDVQVQVRRGVDELEVGQRRRAGRLREGVELGPEGAVDAVVLGPELGPAGVIRGRVAREDRRDRRVAHLERIARHDPHPRPAAGRQRGEAGHVVLADHVGPKLGDDLLEARVHVPGAVDQRLPRRLDEAGQLLDRGCAKHGRGIADEVLPELPRRLLDLGLGPEPHEPLLEPARLEGARE